jgi:hypothetical protein
LDDLKNQKSEAAKKIVEQILNLIISPVTIKNILILSPTMQQKIFRSQTKKLKLKIRSLNIIESIKKKGMYVISSPRAVIKIEGKVKIVILLNTKADINVITIKVADATNLPILEIIPIKIKIFTGHNT